jgi:ABC-2 type transport system permease protein
MLAFVLVERGFRRGFISLSQGEGRQAAQAAGEKAPENISYLFKQETAVPASAWSGTWAVAGKDLLTFKRDTREWFGILIPLILMAFFVGQYFLAPSASSRSSMITVLIIVHHYVQRQ